MKDSVVGDKSLDFAKRIVKCYRHLKMIKRESILSAQLLRSGTSVGANVREGLYAQSRKDFISKMNINLTNSFIPKFNLTNSFSKINLTNPFSKINLTNPFR